MNIKRVISILLGLVLVSFGIAFLAWNLLGYDFNNIAGKKSKNSTKATTSFIDEKRMEDLDGVKEIDVKVPIAKINIICEDRKDISIHYHGHLSSRIKSSLTAKKSGDKFILEIKNSQKKPIPQQIWI